MMNSKTLTDTQELFGQFTGKTVEALTLWADANQKVFRDLADLSANTAKEGVRLFAELQASAVEALKEGQAYWLGRQGEVDVWQKDPFAWYQKSLLEGTEQTQKAFKLVEGNAQAIARSAERVQATAEQAAREIQQTFASVAEKAKTLYTPSQN
jgi:head-tail adaptor